MATTNNWGLRQMDCTGAYLNGVLDRPIYLIHPLGKVDENGRPVYLECCKTIYGLKQSGFCWAKLLHSYLTEAGFKRSNADSCMFRLKTTRGALDPTSKPLDFDEEVELIVGSYVDDLCYAGNSDWILNWFHDFIAKRFTVKQSETGPLEWILGARVRRNMAAGTTSIDQEVAIRRLAEKLGLDKSNPVRSPMISSSPLLKPDRESRPPKSEFDYLSIVGSLLHIVNFTRPDCAYAVSALARHSSNYDRSQDKAVKRVVQCLYHTSHLAITYFRDGNVFSSEKNTATVWEAGCYPLEWNKDDVTDASFGDESVTRRSSSGELIFI